MGPRGGAEHLDRRCAGRHAGAAVRHVLRRRRHRGTVVEPRRQIASVRARRGSVGGGLCREVRAPRGVDDEGGGEPVRAVAGRHAARVRAGRHARRARLAAGRGRPVGPLARRRSRDPPDRRPGRGVGPDVVARRQAPRLRHRKGRDPHGSASVLRQRRSSTPGSITSPVPPRTWRRPVAASRSSRRARDGNRLHGGWTARGS